MADPFSDPQVMALLGLSQGLLSAGGPSRLPINLGGALAQGMGGALSGAQGAQNYNLQQQKVALTGFQAAHAQYQAELQAWAANGGRGPAPTPPDMNMPGMPQRGVQPQAQPNAAAGPTGPGMSEATSSAAFGTPDYASQTPSAGPNLPDNGLFAGLPEYAKRAIISNLAIPGSGEVIMKANAPIPMRQGPLVSPTGQMIFQNTPPVPGVNFDYGPGGKVTSAAPIPGFSPTVASIEGAKAGATASAKSGFEFEPYTLASGETIGVPKNIAAQGPDAIKQYVGQLQGGTPAPKPMQPRDSGDPWASIPKLETPKGFGQSTYQKGRMQGAATIADELTKKTSDAAAISNERLVYNGQALDLLNSATTGKGALAIANVKNFLNSRLNVPLDVMDKAVSGDANATTALNKDLINAATQKAKQAYGSRITQSEVMLQIKQASPNVDQMTATIKYLLQTDSAMSQYQIQKAQNLGKYLQNGGDPYQFEGWHSKSFPMSKSVSDIHLPKNGGAPQGALDYLKSNPESKDAFKAKYGYLP